MLQLFVANQNKPADIVGVLVANRSKLLRLFAGFKLDKGSIVNLNWVCNIHDILNSLFKLLIWDFFLVAEDEQFEADKAQVVKEIAALELQEASWAMLPSLVYL